MRIPEKCNGCGKPLLLENLYVEDGCPCNTPKGVNIQPRGCATCGKPCSRPGHRLLELFGDAALERLPRNYVRTEMYAAEKSRADKAEAQANNYRQGELCALREADGLRSRCQEAEARIARGAKALATVEAQAAAMRDAMQEVLDIWNDPSARAEMDSFTFQPLKAALASDAGAAILARIRILETIIKECEGCSLHLRDAEHERK